MLVLATEITSGTGPLPPQDGEFLPMFAEMAACADLSPELSGLHDAWLRAIEPREAKLQTLKAELDADERVAAMKQDLLRHWASFPKDAVIAQCQNELTFWQHHR